MRLTVVGSAPAYSLQPGRASSSYLVEHEDTAVVLDFGQGAFSELTRYREPASVAAVVISHLHADHCVDLVPLRHYVKFQRDGQGPALHGPAQLRARFGAFQVDPGFFNDLAGSALEPGTFRVGSLEIEARRVTHIPDSFAFRVSVAGAGPASPGLVYSGDCGVWGDLVPLIRPTDTVLSEAAFGTRRPIAAVHLTGDEAARAAVAGQASRLFLTHLLERYDQAATLEAASETFGRPVEVATPGLTVDFG
jgi:ribonuclease BN (tRNA processing enzyme)